MCKNNIREKIDEPTAWVNPIVIMKKINNDIRICLYPLYLNEPQMRQHCKLPTFEEWTTHLKEAQVFSKLDSNKGFYQIKLTEECSILTTLVTPVSRFCFKRLSFGLVSDPEIFLSDFQEIFKDTEGVKIYINDKQIFGTDVEEYDNRLRQVIDMAKEMAIQFNKEKCKIEVDPEIAKAIIRIPEPKNIKDLCIFLEVLTYVFKYIPNLSEFTDNLRVLMKNDLM